ncbi:MAG: BtpA/SgcQ family protein [Candidatus Limnocylindria bacterium]
MRLPTSMRRRPRRGPQRSPGRRLRRRPLLQRGRYPVSASRRSRDPGRDGGRSWRWMRSRERAHGRCAVRDGRSARREAGGGERPGHRQHGGRAESVTPIFEVADGCIVGTSLERDGVTWNPVERERAERFMDAVREARSRA